MANRPSSQARQNAMKCIDGPYFPVVQILRFLLRRTTGMLLRGRQVDQFACDTRQNPVCGRGAAQGIVFPPQMFVVSPSRIYPSGVVRMPSSAPLSKRIRRIGSHSVKIGTFVPWLFAKVGDVAVNQPDS